MSKEIERKWLVNNSDKMDTIFILNHSRKYLIAEQRYLYCEDTEIRIGLRQDKYGETQYLLTVKSPGDLVRSEIEVDISEEDYYRLAREVNYKPIRKSFNVLKIDGVTIECNFVDGKWYYLEKEFTSEEEANSFDISKYLPSDIEVTEVTYDPRYKMKNYWKRTRINGEEI